MNTQTVYLTLSMSFLLLVQACTPTAQRPVLSSINDPAVIYHEDSRQDVSESEGSFDAGNVTAVLIEDRKLKQVDNGWLLKLLPLKNSIPLCKDERFLEQPILGFCSGVLIAPNKVLTAGHCMDSQNSCEKTKFIFGWNLEKSYFNSLPDSEIFHCQQIQVLRYQRAKLDYAIVELDRPVPGVNPVKFADDISLDSGTSLISLSYPLGLPLKKDLAIVIEDDPQKNLFKAEVDTFGGSSGSPLFNAEGQLVGILSRGMEDILDDDIYRIQTYGGCLNFNRCKNGYCTGESFFKVNRILPHDL